MDNKTLVEKAARLIIRTSDEGDTTRVVGTNKVWLHVVCQTTGLEPHQVAESGVELVRCDMPRAWPREAYRAADSLGLGSHFVRVR